METIIKDLANIHGSVTGHYACSRDPWDTFKVFVSDKLLSVLSRLRAMQNENPTGYGWDYHTHGPHQSFRKEDWCEAVANGDTILGYQVWVAQNLEDLLHDEDLDGVDAIEVAGCTETDGHVDVVAEGEEAAEFFSVYTHVPNQGVECVCDFNTKEQAVSFAKALAARKSLPVYGNCCNIED